MDLNHFYSQHQFAVMRAGAATTRVARIRHRAAADVICDQIRRYQISIGAPASSSWLRVAAPTARGYDAGQGISS